LVEDLIPAEASAVIFGLPSAGKSFFLLDLALHIAAGRSWFGRETTQGGVVYLAPEGQRGMRMRVAAWKHHHGAEAIPFALVPVPINLLDCNADLEALRQLLHHCEQKWGDIALLCADTLKASLGGGDENGADMDVYHSNVRRLCAPYGCTSAIVTHVPLTGDMTRPRGHGSLWGSADTAILLRGDDRKPYRRATVTKQKDGAPGPDIFFSLKPIELGTDKKGKLVTSCVIEPAEADEADLSHSGERLAESERVGLAGLERVLAAKGVTPPRDIPAKVLNRASVDHVVRMSEWRSEATPLLSKPDTKPDSARRKFDRVRDNLKAADILDFWGDWVWLQ
jgi:hypothetical protein